MTGFALLFLFAIAIIVSVLWLRPAKVRCPVCDGRKAVLYKQDVEKVRPYDLISGEGGGKMLMMEIKETFRCSHCDHIWTRTRTEA